MLHYNDELYHHGVLGQKWGVRRYQNSDGTLTNEGRKRYSNNSTAAHLTRAVFNTTSGQKRVGVLTSPGYRADKKEIKAEYKKLKKTYKKIKDENTRNEKMRELKEDYKKTLEESRIAASKAIYPWQSDKVNEYIQSGSFKANVFLSNYGNLQYNRKIADGMKPKTARFEAMLDARTDYGLSGYRDYVNNQAEYDRKHYGK